MLMSVVGTENAYLRAWFDSQKVQSHAISASHTSHAQCFSLTMCFAALPGRQDGIILRDDIVSSPRLSRLLEAGRRTIARDHSPDLPLSDSPEPYTTLVKALSSYGEVNREHFRPLASYLERMTLPEGFVLWTQGDEPDGLYIIEAGVLRAVYRFAEHTPDTEESMVAGTVAGELSALSESPRNATCVVERPAVVWKLSIVNLKHMETEHPEMAKTFVKLILKGACMGPFCRRNCLPLRQN